MPKARAVEILEAAAKSERPRARKAKVAPVVKAAPVKTSKTRAEALLEVAHMIAAEGAPAAPVEK